ncbi:DHA2 family efflux MFS transporter permease subunit [Streptomyces poonensis]|uniref:MFS transporter n=1 Tax=Streptomyces poonensis TaxID=68255 RepID=A0A918QCQ5_9ACTN|nr:DHA2 family efflux MFS transporter permease subunit [Streptomyces poonensis]GGZ39956.1 MFS transporter [Streptomyces poonensis]GLJ92884.1 MFS transporter [Streptomyces poonensis]
MRIGNSPWDVLGVLCARFFMTLLDTSIVNVAIPAIQTDLNAGFDQVLWVVNGHVLALTVLLIAAGRLGDRFGLKQLYVAGLVVFSVSSPLCGAATSAYQLIAARVLADIGAAMLGPQTFVLITMLFPPNRRRAAIGVCGMVAALSTVSGPLLGGVLVDALGWQWIFLVNVPIGLLTLILAAVVVPDPRPGAQHRFDSPGMILICLALFAISFGLLEGERYHWGTVTGPLSIWSLLACGGLLLAVFVSVQRAQRWAPLVPFALFANRSSSVASATMLCFGSAMIGLALPMTICLQFVLHLSLSRAGITLAVASFASGLVAPIGGWLSDRMGRKPLLILGLAAYAVGLALLAVQADSGARPCQFVPTLAITGIGIGCVFVLTANLAVDVLDPKLAGGASGVFHTTRQIGALLGGSAVGTLLQNRLSASPREHAVQRAAELPPEASASFIDHFAGTSSTTLRGGDTFAGTLSLSQPPDAVDRIRSVGDAVLRDGFVEALRETGVLPIAICLIALLCAWRLAHPAAQAPAASPGSTNQAHMPTGGAG